VYVFLTLCASVGNKKVSAFSWFYCKEICYDARSYERKKCLVGFVNY